MVVQIHVHAPAFIGPDWHNGAMPGAFLHPFAKPSRERFPSITHGKGSLVWDHTGHEMIDATLDLLLTGWAAS